MSAAPTRFTDLALLKPLLDAVAELGYETLTPVQAQSIPLLLSGRDLIGQSKTGSGKTVAFCLPILNGLDPGKGERAIAAQTPVRALVLSPTRELCAQIAREFRKLGCRLPGLQVLVASGGQSMKPQVEALEKGLHIVVGTPGRIMDLLSRKALDLNGVHTVVLDEADRMLDMGFQDDMAKILRKAPKDRQTLFFSATFPDSFEAMSRAYQRNPARVIISEGRAAPAIRQLAYETHPKLKVRALRWLLQQHRPESALVFCNLKTTVTDIARELQEARFSADCIHGDLEQAARDRAMAKFRNLSTRILVATDVAARGIDVEDIGIVFNYDLPPKAEIYTHRIGRTGRAGKSGLAVALASAHERHMVDRIERATGVAFEWKKLPSVEQLDAEASKPSPHSRALMETLSISGGRKDKVRPGDILGALTGEAGGLKAEDIGKIEIHDSFSYVAITQNMAPLAAQRLGDGKIKGRRFRVHRIR